MNFHAVKYTLSLLFALLIMSGGINASSSGANCRIIKNDASYCHEITILKIDLNNNEIKGNSDFHSLKLHTPNIVSIGGELSANAIFTDEILLPSENKTRIAYRLFSTLKM